jgi:hypothetical protein
MSIGLTILGGYLGAGKTTLINRLLTSGYAQRLTILVNDFGAINIDADLIATHDGDTISLSNGCACCQLQDDMLSQLTDIACQPNPPARILVEASGVGEPARLAYLGYGVAGIQLDGVVVAVDAMTLVEKCHDKFVGRLVQRQVRQADALILTKIDSSKDGGVSAREHLVKMSKAPVIDSTCPDIIDLLLNQISVSNTPQVALPPALMPLFDQLVFCAPGLLDIDGLNSILDRYAPSLSRAKGHTGTHRLQLVGTQGSLTPADKRRIQIVFLAPSGACNFAALESALKELVR